MSWGERTEERQWGNLGWMFFPPIHYISPVVKYVNDFWLSHVLRLHTQDCPPPSPPSPAAVTVGKQYATPCLPSLDCVCFWASMCPMICLTKPNPESHTKISDGYDDEAFWQIYSANCSVHMKWGVATHSDHSCSGRMSQELGRCNLICSSCKVKTFIISARGVRCHLHWTWHMHASLTVGDHTHKCTPTSVNTTQAMGDKVKSWRFWRGDRQKSWELMVDGKTKVSVVWYGCGRQSDGSCQKHRDTWICGQKANGKWFR